MYVSVLVFSMMLLVCVVCVHYAVRCRQAKLERSEAQARLLEEAAKDFNAKLEAAGQQSTELRDQVKNKYNEYNTYCTAFRWQELFWTKYRMDVRGRTFR